MKKAIGTFALICGIAIVGWAAMVVVAGLVGGDFAAHLQVFLNAYSTGFVSFAGKSVTVAFSATCLAAVLLVLWIVLNAAVVPLFALLK